ncbi:synaptogenesis protein syg-1-like [Saccoglossus kowalevskii]
MKCTVSSRQPKWYRVVPGGSDMQLSDGTSVLNPYQIVGDQSSGEYFLQIPNVQVSDSHTYQCQLFNADPPYIQASLTVIDTVPSCSVTGSVGGNKVIHGDTVSLQCSANQGVPPAVLVWLRDGVVQYTGTTSQTTIQWNTAIEREDDGKLYKCSLQHSTLTNDISCQSVIQFDVEYDPVISVSIQSGNNQGQIKENDDFVATCVVDESHPDVDSYSWSGPGGFTANENMISLSDIKRSSHGSYTCTARNTFYDDSRGIGTTQLNVDVQYKSTVTIEITLGDNTIDEGYDLELICTDFGVPSPFKYTWNRTDNQGNIITLSEVTDTLQVYNIEPSDAGTYICTTTVKYYDDTESISSDTTSIIVYYSPRINKEISKSGASKGDTATIVCEVDALPIADITWYNNNEYEIDNSTDRILIIEFVDHNIKRSTLWIFNVLPESDYGVYNCTSVNRLESDSHLITLNGTNIPRTQVNIDLIDRSYDSLTINLIPMFVHGVSGKEPNVYYIEYRSQLNASFLHWPSNGRGTTNTTFVVHDLEPSTTFEFRVKLKSDNEFKVMSRIYVFNTYSLPLLTINHHTGIISWTRHEDTKYQCVKIEKQLADHNWDVLESCIDRDTLAYTIDDEYAEYRMTYCTEMGKCDERTFEAQVMVPYTDPKCSSSSAGVIAGVIVSLVIGAVTASAIAFVLHKLNNKGNDQDCKTC